MDKVEKGFRPTTVAAIFGVVVTAFLIGCAGGGGGGGSTGITSTSTTSTSTTSTSTTSTSTTSTSTTSTSTTSTSTTSGTSGTGFLPPDVIFYSLAQTDFSTQVRHIKADGSGDTLYATAPVSVSAAAPNPAVANQFFFAYQATLGGNFGIYRNSSISPTGAIQVVSSNYERIDQIMIAPNGQTMLFVGTPVGGVSTLYRVSTVGGTPLALAGADFAGLSPDGSLVVYAEVSATGTNADLFILEVAGSSNLPIQLMDTPEDEIWPQFSKDGTKVVFSGQPSGQTQYDLYVINVDGTGLTRLTNTNDDIELGPSFNSGDTMISYSVLGGTANASGLYTIAATGGARNQLKMATNILPSTYWTTTTGRGRFGYTLSLSLQRGRIR